MKKFQSVRGVFGYYSYIVGDSSYFYAHIGTLISYCLQE